MSDDEKRGFSGFGNLLSDVDTDDILKNVPQEPPKTNDDASPGDEESAKNKKLFGSKAKWFFGILAVLFIIGVLSEENSSTSSYKPSSSPQYSTTEITAATPAPVARRSDGVGRLLGSHPPPSRRSQTDSLCG